jgi:hypothetical protein
MFPTSDRPKRINVCKAWRTVRTVALSTLTHCLQIAPAASEPSVQQAPPDGAPANGATGSGRPLATPNGTRPPAGRRPPAPQSNAAWPDAATPPEMRASPNLSSPMPVFSRRTARPPPPRQGQPPQRQSPPARGGPGFDQQAGRAQAPYPGNTATPPPPAGWATAARGVAGSQGSPRPMQPPPAGQGM